MQGGIFSLPSFMAILRFFILLLLGLPLALSATRNPDTTQIKSMIDQGRTTLYTQPDSTLWFGHEALTLAESGPLPRWQGKAMNLIAISYWVTTDYDSALHWLAQTESAYLEASDSAGLASTYTNFGLFYSSMGYFDLSLRKYKQAQPLVEKHLPDYKVLVFYNNIANIYHEIEDYETAISYYQKAFNLSLENPTSGDTSLLHNNLGLLYRRLNNERMAIFHLERAISALKAQNNPVQLVDALCNLGGWYALQEQYERADSLYQEALVVSQDVQNPFAEGSTWLKIGELETRRGRYPKALKAADKALALLDERQGLKAQFAVYDLLSVANYRNKSFEAAYDFQTTAFKLQDSLFNEEKVRVMGELTLKYETEIKDNEIQSLQQQEELSRWQKGGLATTIGLVLIIAFLIFRRQRAVIRREKALQEKTKEAAEAQEALAAIKLQAAELEQQRLQETIDHKSKEISNLAMGIIRHHDLLQNLEKNLKNLRQKATPEVKTDLQDMSVMVVSQLSLEKERQDLQLYIEEAEQQFFQILDARFPKLTARERRLCALIRMGYSSKEIAALFNINASSVDMGRYRLRKKLDPEMQITLNEFLGQLVA